MLDAHTQKRLVVFLLGLSIAAFGVGLIVKSELGVSPVMSVPYVVSLYLPFTFWDLCCRRANYFVGFTESNFEVGF